MNMPLNIIYLIIGSGCGGLLVWLFLRGGMRVATERSRLAVETERQVLLAGLAQADRRRAELENEVSTVRSSLAGEIERRAETVTELTRQISQLETTLAKERTAAEEKFALLGEAREKLGDAFKALSADALKNNNQSFLQLAKATLAETQQEAKGDLEKRQQAIDNLVKPVAKSLEDVDKKIHELERARSGAYGELRAQLVTLSEGQNSLRAETAKLVGALKSPTVRGRWGEIQLRRVVELAGMLEYCDFEEKEVARTETGRLVPDLIVKLPGGKNVVIDAKVPLAAYLDALEARDDESRRQNLRLHAEQIRRHIGALSHKNYSLQFDPAPEFVVLFLPGEIFFSAALEQDPSLIEVGVNQNVILATPTTLIALLRAVAYGWKQESLAKNAKQISDLGKDLYRRIATMSEHVHKVGLNLGRSVEAYNQAIGSLERNVLSGARKFKELRAADESVQINEIPTLEISIRELQSSEFTSSALGENGSALELETDPA